MYLVSCIALRNIIYICESLHSAREWLLSIFFKYMGHFSAQSWRSQSLFIPSRSFTSRSQNTLCISIYRKLRKFTWKVRLKSLTVRFNEANNDKEVDWNLQKLMQKMQTWVTYSILPHWSPHHCYCHHKPSHVFIFSLNQYQPNMTKSIL